MASVLLAGNLSWAADLQSLVNNPPFGSKVAPANAADAGQALEFRGTFVDGNERFFSLHDPATRLSQWVGLNESGQPFVVQGYDNAKGSIQVKYRNQVMTLTLKQAQVIVQVPQPPASSPVALPAGPAQVSPPSPGEAGRLAQVAEEIRRRRALRTQGLQQQAPGYQPPMPGTPPGKSQAP